MKKTFTLLSLLFTASIADTDIATSSKAMKILTDDKVIVQEVRSCREGRCSRASRVSRATRVNRISRASRISRTIQYVVTLDKRHIASSK